MSELTTSHIQTYINLRLPEVKAETVNPDVTVIQICSVLGIFGFPDFRKMELPAHPAPQIPEIETRETNYGRRRFKDFELFVCAAF